MESQSSTIVTGYVPRPLQVLLHNSLRRFNVIVCHRRFGKTVFALNHLIDRVLRCTLPMPRGAYIAPTYGQAKRVAWAYLKLYTDNIPGVVVNEADLKVTFPHNNGSITLLSAENPASLKGIYLDIVLLDEFGEMNPVVWREVIRPTLSDRRGSAIFIGTPKGQNHFYDMYEYAGTGDPEWHRAMYKASETGIIPDGELESAQRQMALEEYQQEYECSFNAGLVGAYFAHELAKAESEKRITSVAHERTLLVDTYWDLGHNDAMAIWFGQTVRNEHRFIDYLELSGSDIPSIVAEIKKKPYDFGMFCLPHDAKVTDLSTGRSRIQEFYNLGCRNIKVVPRIGKKMESINAARVAFSQCWFDAEKCKQGLKALANYQKKWDSKNNVFMETPLHNWASNGADAFQQFAMGSTDTSSSTMDRKREEPQIQAETDYNPMEY